MIRLRSVDSLLSSLQKHRCCRLRRRLPLLSVTEEVRRCYHVVVAVSGGVDSSVAAALLKERLLQSTEATSITANGCSSNNNNGSPQTTNLTSLSAIHMSNWNTHDDDSLPHVCPTSQDDWKDAAATCQALSIELERKHLEAEYWNQVFQPYLTEITTKGHVGNPDFGCNKHIKFGALREYCMQKYGPDSYLATGHYARLWHRQSTNPIVSAPSGSTSTSTTSSRPACVEQAMAEDETGTRDWISTWGAVKTSSSSSTMQSHLPSILLAAADRSKDQSYFLAGCSGKSLTNVLFPLGDLYKTTITTTKTTPGDPAPDTHNNSKTVRQLAEDFHLPTANKRESMGICFVGKRPNGFRGFLQHYLPLAASPVDFVDIDTGETVGTTAPHKAHAFLFVPGQGAKLSGMPQKYFVVGNNVFGNNSVLSRAAPQHRDSHYRHPIVWVCAGTQHPALYSDSLVVSKSAMNWMASDECPPPLRMNDHRSGSELRTQCRIRHLQPLMECTVRRSSSMDSAKDGQFLQVVFDKPVRGIAPGQQIVFYGLDGLVCFGGGPIAQRGPTFWERGLALPKELNPSSHNNFRNYWI